MQRGANSNRHVYSHLGFCFSLLTRFTIFIFIFLHRHNAQYKDSLRRANVESSDMELKEHLEGQLRTALDKFKHKRRELHLKEQERDNQLGKQAEAEADLGSAKQELSLLHAEYHNIQRELNDQEAKLGRAQETARKIIQSFRKDAGNLAVETVRFTSPSINPLHLRSVGVLSMMHALNRCGSRFSKCMWDDWVNAVSPCDPTCKRLTVSWFPHPQPSHQPSLPCTGRGKGFPSPRH